LALNSLAARLISDLVISFGFGKLMVLDANFIFPDASSRNKWLMHHLNIRSRLGRYRMFK
jgi:hypothetical protein